jgi:hypothetical protein
LLYKTQILTKYNSSSMKISFLLLSVVLGFGVTAIGTLASANDIKEISDLEQEIDSFGKKKQSVIDVIKGWQNGASNNKVNEIESSISSFFDVKGELSPIVMDRMISDSSSDQIDPDSAMEYTEGGFASIQAIFEPLFEFETKFNEYSEHTVEIEKRLVYNGELNREVMKLVKTLQESQPIFRKSLLILLSNIRNRNQPDFDIRKFYFGALFLPEEQFVQSRTDVNVEELYKIYADQKSRFLYEHKLLRQDYLILDQLFVQFYKVVAEIQSHYTEEMKKSNMMDTVDETVVKGLRDLFELRVHIADIVYLFKGQIDLVRNQKAIYHKIFYSAQRIEKLNLHKKIHVAQLAGDDHLIDGIIQEEKDKKEATADAEEAKRDELEALLDEQAQNPNRALDLTNDQIEIDFQTRASDRLKRAQNRAKRAALRLQRQKDRDRKSFEDKIAKNANPGGSTLSAESFFRNKSYTDRMDKYAEGIQQRIDDHSLSLADVDSTDLSQRIIKKELEKTSSLQGSLNNISSKTASISINPAIII